MGDDYGYYDYYSHYDGETPRWQVERKNLFKNVGHIPNKNEAKKLRQLMAETGLKEEELRKHKKYRKILSDAQKPEVKKEKTDKLLKYITFCRLPKVAIRSSNFQFKTNYDTRNLL